MQQLGETRDPRGLVPGNPGDVRRTADLMTRFGTALSSAGEGLRKIDDDGWTGPTADRFHEVFDGEPRRWIECGDAFEDAGGAVSSYSYTLEWAQGQAAESIGLWDEGEAATKTAKADHEAAVQRAQQDAMALTAAGVPTMPPDIPFHDPGEEKRQAARDKLQRARHQLDEAGDRAEVTVGHARDKAPPKPKWWQKVGEFLSELGKGAWEATVGLVEFAWSISTVRMLVDPAGYAQTVASYVQAAQFAVQHPGEFVKAVVDWDTWKENPGRALGRLVPDIALTIATAGGGAAVKGARGVKALERLKGSAKDAGKPDGDGPVTFRPRSDMTPDEVNQMQRYIDTCNRAKHDGCLSDTGRVSTEGEMRRDANKAALAERIRAEQAGTPYQGQVGHAPDTTWTGRPEAYEWHDQTARVNASLGAQSTQYPVGFKPTEFILGPPRSP